MTGVGIITANGGIGSSGGRIAVKLTSGNDFGSVTMQAYGAPGAAAGTIYTEIASQEEGNGTVTIDNNNQTSSRFTAIPSTQTWTIKNLVLRNKGQISVPTGTTLDLTNTTISTTDATAISSINVIGGMLITPLTFTINGINFNVTAPYTLTGNLILGGGSVTSTMMVSNGSPMNKFIVTGNVTILDKGLLTHTANGGSETHRLFMDIGGNLDVQTGGQINVAGKGYGDRSGPGRYCGGTYSYASHGGQSVEACSVVYGSVTNPTTLGSGGFLVGGGGAAILTVSGGITLNGNITSNAVVPGGGEGGAGGSINISRPYNKVCLV